MNSTEKKPRGFRGRLKTLSALAGLAVVCGMGVVTVAVGTSTAGGSITNVSANTTTQGPPPTSPAIASATPPVKATAYVGGDWAGMGRFTGGDWP